MAMGFGALNKDNACIAQEDAFRNTKMLYCSTRVGVFVSSQPNPLDINISPTIHSQAFAINARSDKKILE